MLIKELSQKTGASIRSLRHYEAKGLLMSQRLPNGYREYDNNAVSRVKVIQLYLSLGLTTDKIAEVIECPTLPETNRPLCEKAYQLYRAKLKEVDQQIDILLSVRERLKERIKEIE